MTPTLHYDSVREARSQWVTRAIWSNWLVESVKSTMTKIIKTCTKSLQRSHRKLHFYALNNVWFLRRYKEAGVYLILKLISNLSIYCPTPVCLTDLHVHTLENPFKQIWIDTKGNCMGSSRMCQCTILWLVSYQKNDCRASPSNPSLGMTTSNIFRCILAWHVSTGYQGIWSASGFLLVHTI